MYLFSNLAKDHFTLLENQLAHFAVAVNYLSKYQLVGNENQKLLFINFISNSDLFDRLQNLGTLII